MPAIFRPHRIGGAAVYRPDYGSGFAFAVSASGIASTLALGAPSFSFASPAPFAVSVAGISSGLAFGSPSLSFSWPVPFTVLPSGIPSALAVGRPIANFMASGAALPPSSRAAVRGPALRTAVTP